MAYATGGLIEATHYNNFINGSNQLNTVWGVGTGNAGYGQTTIPTVAIGSIVTATQWATLINALNSTLTHQSGAGSGISAVTAGARVDYLSTLATNINTSYTNRLLYATSGSTTTGSTKTANPTAIADGTFDGYALEKTVTFSSGDAARYFFNAGGRLQWKRGTATNNDATARSGDLVTQWGALSATYTMGATDYYASTTTYATRLTASNSGTYTGDFVNINTKSNGTQGSFSDAGSVITFGIYVFNAHTNGGFDDTLNASLDWSIDVINPETVNLANSWGTPTVQV
jgi:hypothetical protein